MSHDFLWVVQYLQKCVNRVKLWLGEERVKSQTRWKLEEEEHAHKENS